MATSATRRTVIEFTGDTAYQQVVNAAPSVASPGVNNLVDLATGANTITPPTVTTKACTIIPPSGNINNITLKGVTGDVGVGLHKTDPTIIALPTPAGSFVITTGAAITGVRLIWS